ncbi:AI-2E family transporter, partial [Candidatus Woesearchaeota archaeon]|nr:AI-2E family transporter [Candidatus Woesearchaeota archaeon]
VLFFGVDLVIAIVLITFILNFIPSIGSTIAVGAVLLIYALQIGIGWNLLWLGLILLVVQNFFGNFLEPKITGNKLNMSPILILLGLFFWSWVWGIPGMLLSVPLTASIKITLESVIGKKSLASFFT